MAKVSRPHKSAFMVTAAIVASCIIAVGSVVALQGYLVKQDLIRNDVQARALEVTDLLALQSGPSLRFGREEGVAEPLSRVLAAARGKALAGLGYTAVGAPMAETGSVTDALRTLAQQAAESGEVAISSDGYSVAIPAFVGTDIAGSVAMTWSPESSLVATQGELKEQLVVAAIVTIIATCLATLLLQWHLLRPLNRLCDAMKRIARSDYKIELPRLRREDEIGMINRSLADMRDALEAGEAERRDSAFRSAALHASSAPMMLLDESLVVIYANNAAASLLRDLSPAIRSSNPSFDSEAVVGQDLSQFNSAELDGDERLRDPEQLPVKVNLTMGDTRLELDIAVVRDADGQAIGRVVEANDITESTLNQSVIATLDANQPYAEFDVEGTLVKANDRFASVCGRSAGREIIGKRLAHLVTRVGDSDLSDWQSRLSSGTPIAGKLSVGQHDGIIDGSLFAVLDARGAVMRYLMMGQDVTQSERDLTAAEQRREESERIQSDVVASLSSALREVSGGKLTTRIETPFASDYEQLRADFNATLRTLEELVGSVSGMAIDVRKEAAEIASSADSLSGRTERTAATLEETAAALDELTSSVQSAAESAGRANTVVSETQARAVESGEVVESAVSAMSAIEESSGKIAKIIDVIEDIAFQTNLLALNAGVEAARAGEAGRGFAVVASEVRALAQRSSDAAREINALISASGTQVGRGVDLVGRTGEALQQIVSSITEVSNLVGGIAVSSKEQSTGVAEINTAVNQLDQATQQNAAMFEETTAASHSLTQLAESLAHTVDRFEIGTKRAPAANVAAQRPAKAAEQASAPVAPPVVRSSVPTGASAAVAQTAAPSAPPIDDGWEEF